MLAWAGDEPARAGAAPQGVHRRCPGRACGRPVPVPPRSWMLTHDVRGVAAVDGGEVLGMVSDQELLQTMLCIGDPPRAEVQRRLDEYAGRSCHRR